MKRLDFLLNLLTTLTILRSFTKKLSNKQIIRDLVSILESDTLELKVDKIFDIYFLHFVFTMSLSGEKDESNDISLIKNATWI